MAYSTPNSRYNDIYAEESGPLSMAGLPTVPTTNYGSQSGGAGGGYNIGPITDAGSPTPPATPTPTTPAAPSPVAPPTPAYLKPQTGFANYGYLSPQQSTRNVSRKLAVMPSNVGPNPTALFDNMIGGNQPKLTGEEAKAQIAYVDNWLTSNGYLQPGQFSASVGGYADGGMVEPVNPLQTASAPVSGSNFSISPYGQQHGPRGMTPPTGAPAPMAPKPSDSQPGMHGGPDGPRGRSGGWQPPQMNPGAWGQGMGRVGGYLNDAMSRLPPQMQAPMNRFSTQMQGMFNRVRPPMPPTVAPPLPPSSI